MKTCDRHKTVFKHECAECLHERSREEKAEQKASEKFQNSLKKAKLKQQIPKAKPKQISDKMKEQLKQYSVLRKQYLSDHQECELRLPGCDGIAIEIHHTSSRGKNLNNVSTFKASCRECHRKVHDELSAEEARELGLKVSPIDQTKQTI